MEAIGRSGAGDQQKHAARYHVGLSLAELADVLGTPVGTVGARLHYAARALRAALEADERSTAAKERLA